MDCCFYFDDYNLIRVDSSESIFVKDLHLFKNDKEISFKYDNSSLSFFDGYEDRAKFNVVYQNKKYDIIYRFISHHKRFDKDYSVNVEELGSFYSKEKTIFRIWAPFVEDIFVSLNGEINRMNYKGRGLYEVVLKGDYKNNHYHYCLVRGKEITNVNDPFSYANTVDNKDSIVIDFNDYHFTNISLEKNDDPIIYELSIRDFSSDLNASFQYPKKYQAFLENNLQYQEETIGIDYLKNLGISHIELLPILNFDKDNNEYNWGYNPLNFNTLSYEYVHKDPILEFRQMVDYCHQNNLRVIVDVVFNHVYKPILFNFETILPYYSFRYKKNCELADGTFCGNEIRSEAYMMKEYLKCITKRLIRIFDIDGLRFDLGGILDFNTMNEIGGVARRMKEDFLLIDEGWRMGDVLRDDMKADYFNAKKMPEFLFFNPEYRDVIKFSYLSSSKDGEKKLLHCFGGMDDTLHYSQTLNYVECHDDETLSDYIDTLTNDEDIKKKMAKLSLALIILGRGTPFIAGGQEFLRSKHGCKNSYNAGDDINKIDWSLLKQNKDLVEYTKELIKFRKRYINFKEKDIQIKIEYFYDLPIVSFSDLAFVINNTMYDYDYHSWITFKDVLLPDGTYLHNTKSFKVEKMSLVAVKKS